MNGPTSQPLNRKNQEQASFETHRPLPARQIRRNGHPVLPSISSSTLGSLQAQPAEFSDLCSAGSGDSVAAGTGIIPSGNLATYQMLEASRPDSQFCEAPRVEPREALPHIDFLIPDLDAFSTGTNSNDGPIDTVHSPWNADFFLEDYTRSLPATPFDRNPPSNGTTQNGTDVFDTTEDKCKTADIFRQTTGHTLSIQEEDDKNLWISLVLPVALEHPALYHAIAALTCLHTGQLRAEGLRHLRSCSKLLSNNTNEIDSPLDVNLAAHLILVHAHSWNSETPFLGIAHIESAGVLVEDILSNRADLNLARKDDCYLAFLVNAWIYMDAIARFTSGDICSPSASNLLDNNATQLDHRISNLDSLMGYSTSFFHIVRDVANLVNKIRSKSTSRNSPVIISQALDLKRKIEDWSIPVDLDSIRDHSPLMTDSIQTAEAFRWATLCTLYQTVPELPNQTSYGELAQKTLVYLATIPLSSPTLKTHMFPLMVAGADAVEEEDREFVRERWRAMSQRLAKSSVGRCLDVTEEVWKRRDEYLSLRGQSQAADLHRSQQTTSESSSHDLSDSRTHGTSSPTTSNPGGQPTQYFTVLGHGSNTFPISAAFKKGVDMLTRSGCIEYTVRGRLHWLGVLKDWDLQRKGS